jgi:hypothetical protein
LQPIRLLGAAALTCAAAFLCIAAAAAAAPQPEAQPERIAIAYITPKQPQHRGVLDLLQSWQTLETFRDYLNPLRLPHPLLLKVDECGSPNAWYDPERREVIVCYEYVAELVRGAPASTTEDGISREDAIIGPTTEAFLHEIAHAMFDLLEIPVLGGEEQAADQFAAFALLQLGSEDARRAIVGTAYMLSREAKAEPLKQEDFAHQHSLPAQRFYNLLCTAYGALPHLFADIAKAALPAARADTCEEEYEQVSRAFRQLIAPHFEPERQKIARGKKLLRFHLPPSGPH